MTAVGFEPTQLALVELESTPLDHSGKLSWRHRRIRKFDFVSADNEVRLSGRIQTFGLDARDAKKRPAMSQQPSVYLEPKWLR